MNKLLPIIFLGVAATALASCDNLNTTPKFDDSKSFVSFAVSEMSVNEDKGTIQLPIQMATMSPKAVSITYEIVASEKDNAAKEGTDFKFTDASGVISFDGESLTNSIEIDILPQVGTFTGDKEFKVKLVNATGINIGADNECKVTILDIDHPLADILGEYTVNAYAHITGEVTFTMHLLKDEKDVSVVWCDGFCPLLISNFGYTYKFYGNVSEDHQTITFPGGQVANERAVLYAGKFDGQFIYTSDDEDIVFTKQENGSYATETGIMLEFDESYYVGGLLAGSECTPAGSTVWTKNQ